MKTLITVIVTAVVLTIAFSISLDWAIHFEYPVNGAGYYPIAVTFILGVLAFATLGGIVGAVLDYKAEAN
jgi:hypothetical protein